MDDQEQTFAGGMQIWTDMQLQDHHHECNGPYCRCHSSSKHAKGSLLLLHHHQQQQQLQRSLPFFLFWPFSGRGF